MKLENVRGIIWDLDGTLIDSFRVFIAILADLAKESGRPMPDEDRLLMNYHGSLEDTLRQTLDIESQEEADRLIDLFVQKQENYYLGDVNGHLFDDAVSLAEIAAEKNLPQLLLTNRDHKGRGSGSPKAIVAATVLANCIHEVRAGDEVTYRKPDKRSVADWLEAKGLKAEQTLVIGDQFVDAQLAINIGARAILVKRNGIIPHAEEIQKHELITTVNNLTEVELI
jgi:phosphoglycolate phosphatase-like HAD superfamily hydrolase